MILPATMGTPLISSGWRVPILSVKTIRTRVPMLPGKTECRTTHFCPQIPQRQGGLLAAGAGLLFQFSDQCLEIGALVQRLHVGVPLQVVHEPAAFEEA